MYLTLEEQSLLRELFRIESNNLLNKDLIWRKKEIETFLRVRGGLDNEGCFVISDYGELLGNYWDKMLEGEIEASI